MPEIEFAKYRLGRSNVTEAGEERSRLQLILYFDRPLGYYLFNVYSPAVFIVIMSWFNFWLNRTATPARITLGVTTVLTLSTLMNKADSNLPKTAYPKAIGIYLWVCFVFTFAALVEFGAAAYMEKRRALLIQNKVEVPLVSVSPWWDGAAPAAPPNQGSSDSLKAEPEEEAPKRRVSFISRKMNDPQLLQRLEPSKPDLYSRVLFPLTFAAFNVFYWVYYMYLTKENLEESSQWQSTQVATLGNHDDC